MEAQMKVLDDLVNADRRYVRRLTIWTIAVWAVWVSTHCGWLGPADGPVGNCSSSGRPAAGVRGGDNACPWQGHSNPGGAMPVVVAIFAVVVLTAIFCLPIAGVILLVMMIAARRTATMSQIQASLLSIGADLKLILRQTTPSTGP